MPSILEAVLSVIALVFPIAGFRIAARKPGHTRAQLIAGATLGGGVAGALTAVVILVGGGESTDAMPFALAHLSFGAFVGIAAVAAFAVGEWRRGKP